MYSCKNITERSCVPFSHLPPVVAPCKIIVQFHIQIVTIGLVTELTFEKCQYFKAHNPIMFNGEMLFSFLCNSLILI